MSKKWLVTGGVGFIGHHLSRALLDRGDTVRILDDYSNEPYPTLLKRRHTERLKAAYGDDKLSITEACITNRDVAKKLIDGVDGVVHLAGLAGVRPSFLDPARYAVVNIEGTSTLLNAAQHAGTDLFLFASSSSVYGNSTPLPAKEEEPSIEPESPYAASKRAGELFISSMSKKTPKMRCPMMRFFTVYGPWQRPEMAISSFLRNILEGKSITVFGDGSMRRDFTHIEDIIRGLLSAIDKAPVGPRPFNLGSGAPITLGDLIDAMGRAAKKPVNIERVPVPLGDVDATFADISRANKELGWQPRMKLEDGLTTVVKWLESEIALSA